MDYSADHSASSSQSSVPDPIAGRADQMAWPGAAGHTSVPFPSAADSSGRIADQPWIRVPTRSSYASPACLFSTRKGESKVVTSSPRHASPLLAPFSLLLLPLQHLSSLPQFLEMPHHQSLLGPSSLSSVQWDPKTRRFLARLILPTGIARHVFLALRSAGSDLPLLSSRWATYTNGFGYTFVGLCQPPRWLRPPERRASPYSSISFAFNDRGGSLTEKCPPPAQRWEHDRMVSLLVRYFYVPPLNLARAENLGTFSPPCGEASPVFVP